MSQLTKEFSTASRHKLTSATPTYPFCVRFTKAERAYLEELAGRKPLGRYIRESLLSERAEPRKHAHRARIEDEQFAALLAALGHSRLSSNLNQLAKSAHCGTLGTPDEVQEQLDDACQAVLEMRNALIMALGLKVPGGRS